MKTTGIILGLAIALFASASAQPNASTDIANKFVFIEFQATDLAKTKTFFEHVFDWNFADQGPSYTTFFDGRIAGGFIKSDKCGKRDHGAALISIYSTNLEETRSKVVANEGKITQDIVGGAGGRRFVFEEPSGNEFAVVSSK